MVTRDVVKVVKLHSPTARAIFKTFKTSLVPLSNGIRTGSSPIRSVIPQVITKSDDAQRESDLFITSMITDRIGRHEVFLPINRKNYNFREKKIRRTKEA